MGEYSSKNSEDKYFLLTASFFDQTIFTLESGGGLVGAGGLARDGAGGDGARGRGVQEPAGGPRQPPGGRGKGGGGGGHEAVSAPRGLV